MTPDAILTTERLSLRTWRSGDLDELAQVFADPQVWWFPLQRGYTRDETESFQWRQLAEWQRQGWGLWAVEYKGNLIGYTGFALPTFLPEVMPVPEIGWRLHPSYWGRGIATEAANAALVQGFTVLGFNGVVSVCEPDNTASARVMERIGMTLDRDTMH
ncbi:MAG TPA: GNAT family N-acetyltransferase, partial [Mycobacteriales bacterium]|nr:GNAT family N-acetyltransferase [Mycobacteriales bacterium]